MNAEARYEIRVRGADDETIDRALRAVSELLMDYERRFTLGTVMFQLSREEVA